MNTLTKSLLTLALGAATLTSIAQDAPRPPRGEGGRPGGPDGGHPRVPPPIVAALDADKNHEISAEEIAGGTAALSALDKNNDGNLTSDEILPARPVAEPPRPEGAAQGDDRGGHPRPRAPLMRALDADHDGMISADELANAPAELKTLDKSEDGKLSREEFSAGGPRGSRGPGGPGGQRHGRAPKQA